MTAIDSVVDVPRVTSKRPFIFLSVGIFNTLVDFFFYTLLTQTVFTKDSQIGIAGFVSGLLAFAFAFLTHKLITWRERPVSKQTIIRFIGFTGFGLWILRPVLLSTFVHLTPLYKFAHDITTKLHLPFSQDFVTNTGAFGLMVCIVLLYNYFTYDRFVFKGTEKSTPA